MFAKTRAKKSCRCTPMGIESKLKPLPNIGNSASPKVANTCACKARNSVTGNKNISRSNCRTARSGSVTERDGQQGRFGKVFHASNKRVRGGVKYIDYGRSTDPCFEDTSRRHVFPDPYADLKSNLDSSVPLDANAPWWLFLAEMRLQAGRQAVNIDSKSDAFNIRQDCKNEKSVEVKTGESEAKNQEIKVESNSDTKEKDTINKKQSDKLSDDDDTNAHGGDGEHMMPDKKSEGNAKSTKETVDDDDNDDEDDEEEDESGLPPAVRAMQQKPPTPTARDVVRERHRAMMEEIARTVSKCNLMTHLKTGGFFNYDYSQHARTNSTNNNLRKGKKKGIERLLLLLSCRPAKCTGELYGSI